MKIKADQPSNNSTHLVWGAALVLVGIAVFFRIPQVMPKLADMGMTTVTIGFARVCFYLMGIILIGGGIRKIVFFLQSKSGDNKDSASGPDEHGSDR